MLELKSASSIEKLDQPKVKILALGFPGSGKTTQIGTFPGKKFCYLFDPNAAQSLQGIPDLDYVEVLPDRLPMGLTSLSSDVRKSLPKGPKVGADPYRAFEADFDERVSKGFFDAYDMIVLDSLTTLSDLVMDGVLAINGRSGQQPQQDDYGPVMIILSNICRQVISMGKHVYVTGHLDMKQDDLTKKIINQPLLIGRLRIKLPILFSDALIFTSESDGLGKALFNVQTKPDRYNPTVRTSIKNLEFHENITLDFSRDLVGQGLGGIFFPETRQESPKKEPLRKIEVRKG